MSVSPALVDDRTRSGRIRFPRLSRTAVGRRSRISFENVDSRLEGSRDVVTSTRGSWTPERWYSSSRSAISLALRSGRDSSYWKSFLRASSFATEGSTGRPEAMAFRSFARFSLVSASLRTRAWR